MEEIQVCENCGKDILKGDKAIEIRYGKLEAYARVPHIRVDTQYSDFFHASCPVAIRQFNEVQQ